MNNLRVENKDQILLVTIAREQALNALNHEVLNELSEVFTNGWKAVDGLKGVIITGEGAKAFVAGADISEFVTLTQEEGERLALKGQQLFQLIEDFHLPVIAAVNGFALGGGCELAMACHIRIASSNAKFGQPEVNLGLIPGYGGTQRLTRLVGVGKALELLLTADMVAAEEAKQIGLVNHVVEPGKEVETAITMINKIATKGPLAVNYIIDAVYAYFHPEINGFEYESKLFGELIGSSESKEGVQAFLEKRKPQFKK